jgi:glutamate/tyrosine decarboxylase-like PLP-dependent enzyme
VDAVAQWQSQYGPFEVHPSLQVPDEVLASAYTKLTERLTDNYPFGHPRYVGQMLKPPHPVATLGYLTAMLINPNNHALDGGPATAAMEKEVVAGLARVFGFADHLGHLTSSGTIANLEALWVARQTHPGKAIAFSADAHYTHARMCEVLGVEAVAVATDERGRMDLAELDRVLSTGRVGTVVATLGTTGLGALDPLDGIIELARQHGARVHVDSAYGGFFRLIADNSVDGVEAAPFAAMSAADSIVVDPHKHGLQPYGCGAVLFADPSVGRFYVHDSPYTYFSSDELHLGEISLECSRAGAAAAALWLTMEVIPFTSDGLGQVLRANRAAALQWYELLTDSVELGALQRPELDIVAYWPRRARLSEIDQVSARVFVSAAQGDPRAQIHLATYNMKASDLERRSLGMELDQPNGRILRSVVMKPESAAVIPEVHARLSELSVGAR